MKRACRCSSRIQWRLRWAFNCVCSPWCSRPVLPKTIKMVEVMVQKEERKDSNIWNTSGLLWCFSKFQWFVVACMPSYLSRNQINHVQNTWRLLWSSSSWILSWPKYLMSAFRYWYWQNLSKFVLHISALFLSSTTKLVCVRLGSSVGITDLPQ